MTRDEMIKMHEISEALTTLLQYNYITEEQNDTLRSKLGEFIRKTMEDTHAD